MSTKFSVIIPARNEERVIGRCLESIRLAAEAYRGEVETIVVLNRCSDRTEEIARGFGAVTIREDARSLARIRNAGARCAAGSMLVTIDADSTMTPRTLAAIDRALSTGRTVGGGTLVFPERLSAGIVATFLVMLPVVLLNPVTGGLFWCRREDFAAIGGFNEDLVSGEDYDFALRLKTYGKSVGRPFSTLRGGHIVTSCRKFDEFGDWHLVRNPLLLWRLATGGDGRAADAYYYDVER
ncbi:MAG: glycosyltransferase [Acidobacteriia bacterium]|nr:glycosyltransferase [Terriglobia bacterium]